MAGWRARKGWAGPGGAGWGPSAASLAPLPTRCCGAGKGCHSGGLEPEFWSMRCRESKEAPRKALEWQVLGNGTGEGGQSLVLGSEGTARGEGSGGHGWGRSLAVPCQPPLLLQTRGVVGGLGGVGCQLRCPCKGSQASWRWGWGTSRAALRPQRQKLSWPGYQGGGWGRLGVGVNPF